LVQVAAVSAASPQKQIADLVTRQKLREMERRCAVLQDTLVGRPMM
jgi:hypothetical protein